MQVLRSGQPVSYTHLDVYKRQIIERIDRPCEYVEVAQTALIACQYLYLWLFAGPDDAYKVYSLRCV